MSNDNTVVLVTALFNVHCWLGNSCQENTTLHQTVELNYSSNRNIVIASRAFVFASSYAKAAAYCGLNTTIAADSGLNTKARFQVIVVDSSVKYDKVRIDPVSLSAGVKK